MRPRGMRALRTRGTIPGRGRAGTTLVEFSVALFISLFVVYALGRIIITNQRSWEWGRDKATLQANVTEALEGISRSVRGARRVEVASPTEFRTYDESGALAHTYRRFVVSGQGRLQQDGRDLVARVCTQFAVAPNTDTSSVSLTVELQDNSGNKVSGETRAALRNRFLEF